MYIRTKKMFKTDCVIIFEKGSFLSQLKDYAVF